MKKGACLIYDPEFVRVYASKGGKQTEFWFFDVLGNTWVETNDTIPKAPANRGPYGGAAMVYGRGKIYALKGNKTREFWRYNANFPLYPPADGQQATVAPRLPRPGLTVAPNPVVNQALVRYNLNQGCWVRLAIFDISGRVRRVLVQGYQPPGEYFCRLDIRGLSAGVYLARLEVDERGAMSNTTRKVLVVR
jgi:hypothetical protein